MRDEVHVQARVERSLHLLDLKGISQTELYPVWRQALSNSQRQVFRRVVGRHNMLRDLRDEACPATITAGHLQNATVSKRRLHVRYQ